MPFSWSEGSHSEGAFEASRPQTNLKHSFVRDSKHFEATVGIVVLSLAAIVMGLLGRMPRHSPLQSVTILTTLAADPESPITLAPAEQLAWAPQRIAIVGGGPAGLSLAIGLARRGWSGITVLDKRPPPPWPDDGIFGDNSRHYMLGISGRGQRALRRLGVMDAVDACAHLVRGRMDWNPGTGTGVADGKFVDLAAQRGYITRTIQRDRLSAVLYQEAGRFPNQVTLQYETDVTEVRWATDGPAATLTFPDGTTRTYDVVFGADGVGSTVRDAMERDGEVEVRRYVDDNALLYKTIPMYVPADWRGDLNYSCRTSAGLNLDALPTAEGPYIGVLLFRPGCEMIDSVRDVPSARQFFDTYFPMFTGVIRDDDLAVFAAAPPSKLPVFRTVTPRLHRRLGGAALLGDCIHTVKPYFGLGANSAFEDVTVFMDCLTAAAEDLPTALKLYSEARADDAFTLVRLSHMFDRPGLGTFVCFLLPIILDNIFHTALPSVFAPNALRLLQDPNLRFVDVAQRKRRDRLLQVAILVPSFVAIGWAATSAVAAVGRFSGILGAP